jgi:hypothetical protein
LIDEISNESLPVLQIGDNVGDEIKYSLSEFKDPSIVGLSLVKDTHEKGFNHDYELFLLDESALEW